MNILLLTSEFAPAAGGIGTYAREMAAAAVRLGADVTVVAPDYADTEVARVDRAAPFRIRRFPGGLHSMRDTPKKIRLAQAMVAAGRHDVVHAVDWPFFLPLALARRRTAARLLLTVHGTEINEMQTRAKRLAVRLTGTFGPRAEVVANSGFTRELFLTRFDVPAERVRAVPLGVSEFWFGPRADPGDVRQRLAVDPDAIVMVTVARLTRRKGHLATLAALRLLPESLRARITWLIIGPDGEADYVAELRGAADAAETDIRFLGRLADENIRDIYGCADFFCLTGVPDTSGRVEGFGLVYLEAGACDLPSVASDIGGVAEAVVAGRSGLLVASAPSAIADAIARLAANEHLRTMLGRGALTHTRRLSWDRCAAETYGLAPVDDLRLPPIDGTAVVLAPADLDGIEVAATGQHNGDP
ncbi:MAG TPA: glycosyltransferase family 4 protein [Xanthobacteraceae bacterium]|jgi:glycosyltransferase involved in cell wall biosynthesis